MKEMDNSGIFIALGIFISSIVIQIDREESYHLLKVENMWRRIGEKWYKM